VRKKILFTLARLGAKLSFAACQKTPKSGGIMSSLDIDVLHAFKTLGVSDEEAERAAMALHKRD